MDEILNALLQDDAQEEVVDPQDEEITDEGAEEDDDEEGAAESESEDAEEVATPQSRSVNHEYARARKAAEEDARNLRAKLKEQSRQTELLQNVLKNFGYEGSAEEIADALEAQRTQMSVEEVRRNRQSQEEALNKMIENHPAVKAAMHQMEELKNERIRGTLNSELKKIQKLNPEIKNLSDLQSIENAELFDTLVKGGLHIDKAYEYVHSLNEKTAQAKPDGKGHFKHLNGSGTGSGTVVPRKTAEMYRAMMPGITDKEIREDYAKRQQEKG